MSTAHMSEAELQGKLALGLVKLHEPEALGGARRGRDGQTDLATGEAVPATPAQSDPALAKHLAKCEDDMQAEVEGILHHLGFWRRSKEWIRSNEKPPLGWQFHMSKLGARRNPMLLDILLLRNDGHYAEFELKVPGGAWTSEQQQILCEDHGLPKFESTAKAITYTKEWICDAQE